MTQETSRYVFISYNRKDDAVMQRIVSYLRGRGINVWVDNERLVPGTAIWEEEIEKAIQKAFAVIVILSPSAKSSEWVRREVTMVDQFHKMVFPILITGVEEDAIPIRLITRQFVDLRKNENEGLLTLYKAVSAYRDELDSQTRESQAPSEKIIPQVVVSKTESSPAEPRLDRSNSAAMAEMIRVARERERRQLAESRQTGKTPPASHKKKSNPLAWLLLAGGGILCLAMIAIGPLAWKAVFPSQPVHPVVVSATLDGNNIIIEPTNTARPTETDRPTNPPPPPPTITQTFTPSPAPTFTFTPIPTDTPPAPTDPVEFLIFYFNTVVFQQDYQKGWTLLTPDFQANKTGGWSEYINFWSSVKKWDYSSTPQTDWNSFPRARVLITYRLYYYNGKSDPVDGVHYCLLWSDVIHTWQIDLRENCP